MHLSVNVKLLSLRRPRLPIRSRGLHTGENQWHWNSLWVFTNVCATTGGKHNQTLWFQQQQVKKNKNKTRLHDPESKQGGYSIRGVHGDQPGRFSHNRPRCVTHTCTKIELIISLIILEQTCRSPVANL